jgi:meso-butanediol dehydrogenase / (S,S)-butanediol dehydrogenase / diacetyl reductase
MDLGLEGRIALVAGGGRGVGRACALALAREGAQVAVLARTAAAVDEVAAAIGAAGGRALPLTADLTDETATGAALARLEERLGPPTLLVVAAAAVYRHQKLHHVSAAETAALLDLDLGAPIRLCRQLLPGMLAARHGRVVLLGSLAARTSLPGATLYTTAKAALEGLARGLAVDYSRHGITANTVCIGYVDGERLARRLADDPAARERLARGTATRKLLAPEEVASVVTFLCSARASGVTGAVVEVTGGAHLGNLLS